jgi:hypothetical protein
MVYHCHLDDSKDKNQTKIMVSAGFFGTKEDWGSLRIAWKSVLRNHGIEYFKSSEYNNLTGQFAKFRTDQYPRPKGREAAQQIREELQGVLEKHPNIHGIGVLILLEDYSRALARPDAEGVLPPNPYHAALNSVIYETVKLISLRRGHNAVAFVHDDGPDFGSLESSYKHFAAGNPITAKRLGGFAGLDDKQHPPLQAADMVSNYAMQRGLEALGRNDGSLKTVVKEMKTNIKKLGYWDENYVLSVLKHQLLTKGRTIPIDLQDERYD